MVRWTITEESLSLFDRVPPIEAGTLDLSCQEIESAGFERVVQFIKEQGTLLHTCSIHLTNYTWNRADLTDIDFATACPHLQTLDLIGVIVNASVFAHPSLELLKLRDSDYRGPRDITIGEGLSDGLQLKKVDIMDCQLPVDTLTVGPAAHLKVLQYYLDEDASGPDVSPDKFVFKACSQLEAITIHVCQVWDILLSGVLPQLERISLDATRYCSYQWKIEEVDDDQRAKYRRMLGAEDE